MAMIQRLVVDGLNGRISCDLHFNPDLNIITGKNGSGKTTLLKLIWYLISGNLERIFPEMTFDRVRIETDAFTLEIEARTKARTRRFAFSLEREDENVSKDLSIEAVDHSTFVEQLNQRIAPVSGASVFFPTFRRIEGGFRVSGGVYRRDMRFFGSGPLESAMGAFSEEMSVFDHRFVASISTHDIIELLTKRYADVSEQTNSLHSGLSTYITDRIRSVAHEESAPAGRLKDAEAVL